MNTYIITYKTYTTYISSNGCCTGSKTDYIKCSTLEEVKDKISKLQSDYLLPVSNIQIYSAEGNKITKYNNLTKETI